MRDDLEELAREAERSGVKTVNRYGGTVGRGWAWDVDSGVVHIIDGHKTLCGCVIGPPSKGWESLGWMPDCKRCLRSWAKRRKQ